MPSPRKWAANIPRRIAASRSAFPCPAWPVPSCAGRSSDSLPYYRPSPVWCCSSLAPISPACSWLGPPVDFTLNASLPIDGRVFFFTTVLSFAASLIFGLAPALQSARTDLVPALKNEPPTRLRHWHSRDLLVAVQIALS